MNQHNFENSCDPRAAPAADRSGDGHVPIRPDFIRIVPAQSTAELNAVRELFTEYANSLEIDLCFQNFKQELAELPGNYAPPHGGLWLALVEDKTAGCVALRPASVPGSCEMKRLYVRPAFRRHGLGGQLARTVVTAARERGYNLLRLDTVATMSAAIALYESLGFRRIAPYYDNPSPHAVFMEMAFTGERSRQSQPLG